MTDNEIIKNLENAAEWFSEHGRNTNTAIIGICKESVALINRQRAEIKNLNSELDKISIEYSELITQKDYLYDEAKSLIERDKHSKSEAIREFADQLKREIDQIFYETATEYEETILAIDIVVKEMTEDKKNDPE